MKCSVSVNSGSLIRSQIESYAWQLSRVFLSSKSVPKWTKVGCHMSVKFYCFFVGILRLVEPFVYEFCHPGTISKIQPTELCQSIDLNIKALLLKIIGN